jgi:putative protease
MMETVATLKSLQELAELRRCGATGLLFESAAFTRAALLPLTTQSLIEATDFAHQHDFKVYVQLDAIIHETDLAELRMLLEKLIQVNVDYVVYFDLTVGVMMNQLGHASKVIYQPGTFNTHIMSFTGATKLGIDKFTLSKEITFSKIKAIIEANPNLEFSLVGHGIIDMFYSYRPLLSLYHEAKGTVYDASASYKIAEQTRPDERYPLVEDHLGTNIYRAKKLHSFLYREYFQNHLHTFFVVRKGMNDHEYYEALEAYKTGYFKAFMDKYASEYDLGFFELETQLHKRG